MGSMRCFFCESIGSGRMCRDAIDPSERKHLFNVLRGDSRRVLLIDGKGGFAEASVLPGETLEVGEFKTAVHPLTRVHLIVAAPRRNQMDQILRQAAEVGVWSIRFVVADRSVAIPDDKNIARRSIPILKEACKQSHNPFMPQLKPLLRLGRVGPEINVMDRVFYGAAPSLGEKKARDALMPGDLRIPQVIEDICWLVGPEGGFSPEEEDFLAVCGAAPLCIGRHVMRVETAAIAGCVLLMNARQ
ncbi:MAG: 16S rRNA (uracil(1498)-N(3))-methyltransferase [Victivallales bacterium]|nr:16S rRNA (uracil(1498)-N(3))-methyltransferase [Victivallales bacterium]